MRIEVPHTLTPEEARKVAKAAVAEYGQRFSRYSPDFEWQTEDRLKLSVQAKGLTLKGAASIEDGLLAIEADVPFLLRPFAGRAKGAIEKELEKWTTRLREGKL